MLVLSFEPAHISTKEKTMASKGIMAAYSTPYCNVCEHKNLIHFQEKVDMDKSVNDHPTTQLLSSTQVLKWDKGGLKWDKGHKRSQGYTYDMIFN